MSIQTQLRKSAIASTFLSIILIAAVVSGGIEILLSIYREAIRDKMTEYFAERGIDATVFLHEFFPEDEKQLFANGMGSLLPTVVLLLITILIVTTTSTFFSARASRRILDPLNELKTAADHVVQADLDYTISYREDNEFGVVCGAFKEMQTHLKGLIRETLNQEQSRKELIAGISHDLRTPLTAIKGYVRGLQDGVATTPEKTERYLATILAKTTEM
ncbi:MAG: HAMP domain-containing protein, partial [Clostridiales Family XIII bacterium]|nr:HAMP domain-containing protein [Clostridiales Family XIII bacterium]